MSNGWEAFRDVSETKHKQTHPRFPKFIFVTEPLPLWRSKRGLISVRSQQKGIFHSKYLKYAYFFLVAAQSRVPTKTERQQTPPAPTAIPLLKMDDAAYLGDCVGREFPADAETVVWRNGNGVRTVLPYAQPDREEVESMGRGKRKGKGKGKGKGKEKAEVVRARLERLILFIQSISQRLDEDVVNVKQMALLPWYEDLPNKFEVVFLPTGTETDETKRSAINATLRDNLRRGRYTVIRGWEPAERVTFEETSIQKWVGSLSQLVEWQGESTQSTHDRTYIL
jgi:hypothetical protein